MLAALALSVIAMSAPSGADRLAYGTNWHCRPIGSADRYALDFTIEHGRGGALNKKLTVTNATGDITPGISGFGFEHGEKNSFFDPRAAAKDEFYPYAEFTHGFSNYGVSITTMWWSKEPSVELQVTTFNYEFRNDPAKRNQKFYGLHCDPVTAQ